MGEEVLCDVLPPVDPEVADSRPPDQHRAHRALVHAAALPVPFSQAFKVRAVCHQLGNGLLVHSRVKPRGRPRLLEVLEEAGQLVVEVLLLAAGAQRQGGLPSAL